VDEKSFVTPGESCSWGSRLDSWAAPGSHSGRPSRTTTGSEMTPNAERIVGYIGNNPVKARLVQHAHDYPWSSASQRAAGTETSLGAPDTSVCATPIPDKPEQ
jgi:hypothetical protein